LDKKFKTFDQPHETVLLSKKIIGQRRTFKGHAYFFLRMGGALTPPHFRRANPKNAIFYRILSASIHCTVHGSVDCHAK